eukprot:m.112109 g.112109  ORF g.112109 m.112109 type:complete len:379 (-) comp17030_c0_seq2:60-1196(-)
MVDATVVIVGAGPAGLGMAALLKKCHVETIVLERGRVGQSFADWPTETRFISPSFTGNFFGSPDLNAITPDSSPAFGLQTEHPSGVQYVRYLNDVRKHCQINVRPNIEVTGVDAVEHPTRVADAEQAFDLYADDEEPTITVHTSGNISLTCKFLIWAGGEFQFPTHIPHTIRPAASYCDIPCGQHVVLGGAESGMDAAYQLSQLGSRVTVLDESSPWSKRVSDSSLGLSPATLDRLRVMKASGKVTFIAERALTVTATEVQTATQTIPLEHPAINATGFDVRRSLAGDLFQFSPDGATPLIKANDESTKYRNVFLTGPMVKHDKAVFCFIYKYRQRWAVIGREILRRLQVQDPGHIAIYAKKGFLLDDLSCCAETCTC